MNGGGGVVDRKRRAGRGVGVSEYRDVKLGFVRSWERIRLPRFPVACACRRS
jgi:hypothetical protein